MSEKVGKMDKIKERLSWGKINCSIILECYIGMVLFLYPLIVRRGPVLGLFDLKNFIYYGFTICLFLGWFCLSGWPDKPGKVLKDSLDIGLIVCVVLLVLIAVLKIFRGDMTYEKEAFYWCLLASFFMLKHWGRVRRKYLALVLAASIPLCTGGIYYLLTGKESFLKESFMFRQPEEAASFFLLTVGIAVVLYYNEESKGKSLLYLLTAMAGYLVLALQKYMVSISIVYLVLLVIPMIFPVSVWRVAKNLFLCFSFVFLVGLVLIFQYVKGLYPEKQCGWILIVGVAVWALLFIAAGYICQRRGERLQNKLSERISARRIRMRYGQAAVVFFSVLVFCVLGWNRLETAPGAGTKILRVFAAYIVNTVEEIPSTYQVFLEDYGLIGCVAGFCIAAVVLKHAVASWKSAEEDKKVFLIVTFIFGVQTFFYSLQPVSTPIYVVFLALALSKEKKTGSQADLSILPSDERKAGISLCVGESEK